MHHAEFITKDQALLDMSVAWHQEYREILHAKKSKLVFGNMGV